MMSETYSTPVGPVRGGSTPSVLSGVDAVPRRRRDRRPPAGRAMARYTDGPLEDAEAEDSERVLVTPSRHSGHGPRRPGRAHSPGSQPGRGLRDAQPAKQFCGPTRDMSDQTTDDGEKYSDATLRVDDVVDHEENCAACGVNERVDGTRHCEGCHDALVRADGGTDMERWQAAGGPEPRAADELDDGSDCGYNDCDNEADWLVEFKNRRDQRTTAKMCQSCSENNRIYARENELYRFDVSEEAKE